MASRSASAFKVKAGDVVALEMRPTLQSQAFRPEQIPIDVVYEDEHLLVVKSPRAGGASCARQLERNTAQCAWGAMPVQLWCRALASCTGWTRTPAA
jgi:23S rRNA-/tRNA-specific pseudouridylate synthase